MHVWASKTPACDLDCHGSLGLTEEICSSQPVFIVNLSKGFRGPISSAKSSTGTVAKSGLLRRKEIPTPRMRGYR